MPFGKATGELVTSVTGDSVLRVGQICVVQISGKAVSVGFFAVGRPCHFPVVNSSLRMLEHVCTPPLCVWFVAWELESVSYEFCEVHEFISQ